MRFFIILFMCASLYFLSQSVLQEDAVSSGGKAVTPPIWTLPEMDDIPQTKNWPQDETPLTPLEQEAFQKHWRETYATLQEKATPQLVCELSRFGREEMKRYTHVNLPDADRIFWLPIVRNDAGTQVLHEATLEPLPAPYPLRRDLRAFALFDTKKLRICWILVTIRMEQSRPPHSFRFFSSYSPIRQDHTYQKYLEFSFNKRSDHRIE